MLLYFTHKSHTNLPLKFTLVIRCKVENNWEICKNFGEK